MSKTNHHKANRKKRTSKAVRLSVARAQRHAFFGAKVDLTVYQHALVRRMTTVDV